MTTELRSRSFPVLFIVVAAIGFWALVLIAGVRGANLTDPAEILTRGAQATAEANRFHLAASFGGVVTEPESGMPVPLDGTTVEGDVDVDNEAAHLAFAVPAMMGLTGEIIVIGSDAYLKTTLSGDTWVHMPADEEDEPMSEPPDAAEIADTVAEFLAIEGVVAEKLADAECGDDSCYHVRLTVPSEAMAQFHEESGGYEMFGMPGAEAFGDPVVLDLLFEKGDLWLREVRTAASDPQAGDVSATVAFSAYNESVEIEAPPADQVTEEDAFPVPVPFP